MTTAPPLRGGNQAFTGRVQQSETALIAAGRAVTAVMRLFSTGASYLNYPLWKRTGSEMHTAS